jgi:hypothetical protein
MAKGSDGRRRFSIAALMAMILALGLALAALRNADQWWARGVHTMTITSLSAAIVLALIGGPPIRGMATGYTVFGLTYFLSDLLPPRSVNGFGFGPQYHPAILIDQAFILLQPYLKPMPGGATPGFVHYDQTAHSLAVIIFGLLGAILGGVVAARREKREVKARLAAERPGQSTL